VSGTRKLSSSAQIALLVVGVIAVAALGYLFVLGPKRAAASDLESQIAATQAQIDSYRASASTPQAPPPPPVDVAELFGLAKAMPDRTDMASIILELNRIAKDTGIAFDSIAPTAATNATGYQVIPIELGFQGNFYGLSDFLFRLRNLVVVRDGKLRANGRLFNVRSISFGEGRDSFPQVKATVKVEAFVLGEGEETASPAPAPATAPAAEAPASTETTPTDPSTAPPATSAAPAAGATS
jgi:Tfp pilus assembly protein PilO